MSKIKTEMKGSLFEVTFERGCYSDWTIEHLLFSGNDENEVWVFVKIWALQNREYGYIHGMKWNDEKFKYKLKDTTDKFFKINFINEVDWDDDWNVETVNIKRAHVIYVNP